MSEANATGPVLPTVVIGGYLGAGKTTLVNRLLRHAAEAGWEPLQAGGPREPADARQAEGGVQGGGPADIGDGLDGTDRGDTQKTGRRRIAVLVNDFGEVSIDADLIVGAEGGVLSLVGGCVCCSFGADLVGALEQMAARTPRPHVVLIETSGVGLPAAVARTAALMPQVRVEGIVVVADTGAVRRQAAERYVGSTVRRQLQEADLVLFGKADLAPPGALPPLEAWLREVGAAAPCAALPAPGDADAGLADLVFGPGLVRGAGWGDAAAAAAGARAFTRQPLRPASSQFVTRTLRYAEAVDVAALGEALLAQGVLRAKGVLLDATGQWQELQVAGGRVHRSPAPPPGGVGAFGANSANSAANAVRAGSRTSAGTSDGESASQNDGKSAGAIEGRGEGAATVAFANPGLESAGRLVTISARRG